MSNERTPLVVSDERLLAAARDGDRRAFARLYERYRKALWAYCRATLGDHQAAEDVVQETFLRAWSRLGLFEPGRPLWPWLVRIAQRLCIDHWRANAKRLGHEPLDRLRPAASADGGWPDFAERSDLRIRLDSALATLNPRYRRLLLLQALEGWSYEDLARAEGSTVTSVGKVLMRARARARLALDRSERAVLGALAPVFAFKKRMRAARARANAAVGRVERAAEERNLAAVSYEGALCSGVHLFSIGSVALLALLGGMLPAVDPPSAISHRAPASHRAPDADALARIPATPVSRGPSGTTRSVSEEDDSTGLTDVQGVVDRTSEGVDRWVDPASHQTVDNTAFWSMTFSPRFETDHTVFAAGMCRFRADCKVLFVSRDGGASWTRPAAESFAGQTVLLPPDYPTDSRIFAVSSAKNGLQVSEDGGGRFETASPAGSAAAISPAFNSGDPRVLLGGTGGVFEYRDDTGLTQPSSLPVPPGSYRMVFSPGYPADPVVLVFGLRYKGASDATNVSPAPESLLSPSTSDPRAFVFYRCRPSVCDEVPLQGLAAPYSVNVSLSPSFDRDGVAYAFFGDWLYVSRDGARAFERLPWSEEAGESDKTDLVVSPADPSTIFLATTPRYDAGGALARGGVLRSEDGGRSWVDTGLDLPGFERGVWKLAIAPTGRILAASSTYGIACSDDDGRTWRARCDPPTPAP